MLDVPDMPSNIVAVQVLCRQEEEKRVCKLLVCYNVDRVVTTMLTERKRCSADMSFGSPACLSQMKKVGRQENIADDRNSCNGYYNHISNDKETKRMRC
jgi:hypothetical protein